MRVKEAIQIISFNPIKVRRGYGIYKNMGVGVLTIPQLDTAGLKHGFTTRAGGVSPGPFKSLNLNRSRGDCAKNVELNYGIFCESMGLDINSLVMVSYVHGTAVKRVSKADQGRGISREPLEPCDGIITNDPGVVLLTLHADCGAYFVYDPVNNAAGLAHAGWKGTLGRIGSAMIEAMSKEFGSKSKDMFVGIGPCICRDCFEVAEELGRRFIDEFGFDSLCSEGKTGKLMLDLEMASAIQFVESGILPEHLTIMGACTFENSGMFYSYRRDSGITGSMAAFIQVNND